LVNNGFGLDRAYAARLQAGQAGPVFGGLGLSDEQRAQLAFLICND